MPEQTEKKERKPQKLPKILSQQQVQALFATINIKCPTGLRNRVLLECLYRCGLRIAEACNLNKNDIDLQQGFIYVQQGKNSKDRYLPLDQETIEWLKRWEAIRPESELYFCTLQGGDLKPVYIRQVLDRLSKRSGVYIQDGHKKKHVTPHKLRHTFATEILEEGFTLPDVQELLGHANMSTTAIYTHVRPEKLAAKIKHRGL